MIRWFFRTFFPRTYVAMEAESREWIVHCPKCGHEVSVWDIGGIRYKAAGEPVWRRRCLGCGEVANLKVRRRA